MPTAVYRGNIIIEIICIQSARGLRFRVPRRPNSVHKKYYNDNNSTRLCVVYNTPHGEFFIFYLFFVNSTTPAIMGIVVYVLYGVCVCYPTHHNVALLVKRKTRFLRFIVYLFSFFFVYAHVVCRRRPDA